MKYKICLIAMILVNISCRQQNKTAGDIPVIEVNVDNVSGDYDLAGDIDPNIEIIPLATDTACLIGRIEDIQFANDSYYILTGQGSDILRFSLSGQFLSSLKKKETGPDEYLKISGFAPIGENIWVYDGFRSRLLCYDKNGKITESADTDGKIGWCHNMAVINNAIYLLNDGDCSQASCFLLAVYDLESKKFTYSREFTPLSDNISKRTIRTKLSCADNAYTAAYTYCDTLFKLKDKTLEPEYRFSFSARMNNEPMTAEQLSQKGSDEIEGITDLLQTQKSILLVYADKGQFRRAVYNKKTQTCTVYERLINTDIGDLPLIDPVFLENGIILSIFSDTNVFVKYIHSKISKGKIKNKSAEAKFKTVLSELKEDSNPVIIRYKLKTESNL